MSCFAAAPFETLGHQLFPFIKAATRQFEDVNNATTAKTPADVHTALIEIDVPEEPQDPRNAHDRTLSSHPQARDVSFKGLPHPLMPHHRSLGVLPRASKDAFAVAGSSLGPLDTHSEEMEQSRAHVTRLNAQLDASKQDWQKLRRAYRKSRIQYENAIDPFGAQSDNATANQNISGLRERFINDRSLLESYAADIRRIKRKLQAAQSSRGRCELAFTQSAYQLMGTPTSSSLAECAVPLSSAQTRNRIIVPSFASPPEVEFLLERYHARVATENLLEERLADHNYEYWNEVARRELFRDHDEALSVGDDEFEENWEREKNNILQELSKAMEEAAQLKADCASAGANVDNLEPGGLAFTHSSDLANDGYEDSLQAALAQVPIEAFENAEHVRGNLSEDRSAHSELGSTSQLVSRWMESMDHMSLPERSAIL